VEVPAVEADHGLDGSGFLMDRLSHDILPRGGPVTFDSNFYMKIIIGAGLCNGCERCVNARYGVFSLRGMYLRSFFEARPTIPLIGMGPGRPSRCDRKPGRRSGDSLLLRRRARGSLRGMKEINGKEKPCWTHTKNV
jgi:hypothetical protein